MKFKFTILTLALASFAAHSQVTNSEEDNTSTGLQNTEAPVVKDTATDEDHEDDENTTSWDYSFFEKAERDTLVKYDKKIYPFLRFGLGNVSTDQQFSHSDFGYGRSAFFEWGVLARAPFKKEKNTLGILYGLSFSYQQLTPTGNQVLGHQNGQTMLENYPQDLRRKYSYFRNTYINIPFALDFDFSTKTYNSSNRKFEIQDGLNFGFGGYLGYNINSKQFISYKDEHGYKQTIKQHGNWNVNDFNYGLMAYVGFTNTKIIAKYDLQPVFKNNATDQRFWSLGLQLDLK